MIRGNSACVLTLLSLRVGDAEEGGQLVIADAPMPLSGSYPLVPTAFRKTPASLIGCFAGARLDPDATFGQDFVIRVAYSDVPTVLGTSQGSSFSTQVATAGTSGVPAPNHIPQVGGLTVKVDVNYLVQSISGVMRLYVGTQPGTAYAISAATLSANPSYSEVAQAFAGAKQKTIAGAPLVMDAAAFEMLSVDLTTPVLRTIILAAGPADARSFQILTVTFVHP